VPFPVQEVMRQAPFTGGSGPLRSAVSYREMDGWVDGWLTKWPINSASCFSMLTASKVKRCRALYFSNKINSYYLLKTRQSAYTVMYCADVEAS
jgi:hypothetical protein